MSELRLERLKLLSAAMLFVLVASLAVMSAESGDYDATIYVDPPSIDDPYLTPGSFVNVTIKIRDAVDCYSWTANFSWDPTVLSFWWVYLGDYLAGQPDGSSWGFRYETVLGWVFATESTTGQHEGVDGPGTLITYEFEVIDYAVYSLLNIDDDETYIMVYPPYPPTREEVNKENSFFRNVIPGDMQADTPGSDPDRDVDWYDFGAFADAYGSFVGEPNYASLADLQGNTPGSAPDGDVDWYDFGVFADNYGTVLP